jgi:hypothetical protein
MGVKMQTIVLSYIETGARELQKNFPDLATVSLSSTYNEIIDREGIIDMFRLHGYSDPRKMAQSIVGAAINGISGRLEGLANEAVVLAHRERSNQNLVEHRARVGSNIGTALLDKEKRKEIAMAGVRARGRVPVTDKNKAYVIECVEEAKNNEDSPYRDPRGISWANLEKAYNNRFHGGEGVKTRLAIKAIYFNELAKAKKG